MIHRELEIIDTDPGELVTGVVSGWGGGFHTQKNTLNDKKAIPISASEIIARLKNIEKLINRDTVNFLVKGLATHLKDKNNPHNTDISHFKTSILELLYNEYKENGGTESYEYFISRLFEVYRIASVLDLVNGVDDNALATIAIVKKFISNHDKDPHAHSTMFQRLIPGTPPSIMPTFALTTVLGFASSFQTQEPIHWTYIGSDGYLHKSNSYKLPIDYTYGFPMCPIWETRTNYISINRGFNGSNWLKHNIYVVDDVVQSVDNEYSAVAIRESIDNTSTEHKLTLNNQELEAGKVYTYSIYYKPEYGRYLELRLSHYMFGTLAYVRYDTTTNEVLSTANQFNIKITPEVIPTSTGFHRYGIIFTMPNYSSINIDAVFYKNSAIGTSYLGSGQLLGAVDLAQLENGIGMSPVIYTDGEPVTRPGVGLRIPIDSKFDMTQGTLAIKYIAPTLHNQNTTQRTLLSIRSDDSVGIKAYYENENMFYIDMKDIHNSDIIHYPLLLNTTKTSRYVGIRYTDTEHIVGVGNTMPQILNTITERRTDMTYIDIGHDNHTAYLNGYIDKIVYYKQPLTLNEFIFTIGDE